MADFSPEFYLSHTTDVNRGCVDVVAEGTVRQQAYIGGSSPEDITFTVRAIGCLDFTDIPDTKRATVQAMLDTVQEWEVF
jgi:hypothetical protein